MRLKKNILAAIIIATVVISAKGQSVDFTQYYLNSAGNNPGYTGSEEFLDTKVSFRQGWNTFGIRNNYVYASAYTSLNNSKRGILRQNGLHLSDPEILNKVQSTKAMRRKHGIGGMVTDRKLGPYELLSASANYAYHLPIGRTLSLGFGTKLGIQNQRIDFTGYTVRDNVNDQFYQSLMSSSAGNQMMFQMDFGLVLYSNKFNIGISTNNLVQSQVSGEQLVQQTGARSYMLQASAMSISMGKDVEFTPGGRVMYTNGLDMVMQFNGRFRYKKVVYVGAGFSNQSSKVSLLAGLNLQGGLSVNYAYDRYMGDLNNFNVSVHEINLGIALFNKFGAINRFW
jgi:type IX secretion system PorP/SprF family membrane protein